MGVSRTYFVKNAQQLCQKRCFLTCFGAITLSPYNERRRNGRSQVHLLQAGLLMDQSVIGSAAGQRSLDFYMRFYGVDFLMFGDKHQAFP
jgi:hypothetical protein